MHRRPITAAGAIAAAVAVGAVAMAGCGSSGAGSGSGGGTPATSTGGVTGRITVFAAASLTSAFTGLGKQFEAAHRGTTVRFSFGPSSGLAEQIGQGAPADVFASASGTIMDQVVAADAAADPTTFARNAMEIAVPAGNPAGITGLADLTKPGVKVALCQAQVPCGRVARQVLANAALTVRPVTEEVDVKATLSKVQLGEVDAGVVYVTDVLAAGDKVTGIEIPADVNASTSYPIAALTGSKNAATAQAFVDYVLSADGAAALAGAGFRKP